MNEIPVPAGSEQENPVVDLWEALDQEAQDFSNGIADSAGVTWRLKIIKNLQAQMDTMDKQQTEAIAWYLKRNQQLQKQIDFFLSQIHSYFQANGLDRMATPNGTVFYQTRTDRTWPDNNKLLEWAKTKGIEGAVRAKEEPDKKVILDYIQQSGDSPEGFSLQPVTRLQVRTL